MNTDQLTLLFSQYAVQSPVLLVSLAACLTILARWRQVGSGAIWALLGFGLALVVAIMSPATQWLIQRWAFQSHDTLVQRGYVFTIHATVWSILRAVSYLLLLAGVFAGRPAPPPVSPFFSHPNESGL